MTRSLPISVRHTRELTDPSVPCREENLRAEELHWRLPVKQTGLVMVDCWNDYPLGTYLERARRIAIEKISPVIEACRAVGVQVIHAPSPDWARNYPKWRFKPEYDVPAPSTNDSRSWPPQEFRNRQGDFAAFAYPPHCWQPLWESWLKQNPPPSLRITRCLEPRDGDFVVAVGEELHELCRQRELLHLFYAGFAANICVQHRDYGMRAMRQRGYNTILLRDCTTAIETAETLPGLWMTRTAILNIEMKVGFSTTAAALKEACRNAAATSEEFIA